MRIRDRLPQRQPVELESSELSDFIRKVRGNSVGALDDATIEAIVEMTGASSDLVRLSIANSTINTRQNLLDQSRAVFMSMDPTVRRLATVAWLALVVAGLTAFSAVFGDRSSFLSMASILISMVAIHSALTQPSPKLAMFAGGAFGGVALLGHALFLALLDLLPFRTPQGPPAGVFVVSMIGGALGSLLLHRGYQKFLGAVGFRTASDDRMALLKQMVQIQDQLREHEREIAFLSLDIVGSVRLKEGANVLSVEFTFSEYHQFVERIVARNNGRVHSTAGDGITCAFENSIDAFRASRQIQSGLFEFNSFRNRLSEPIRLRGGIHFGTIIPHGPNSTDVNFSDVIDFAAHLQKVCPVGGIAMSEAAAESLGPDSSLLTDTIEVDGRVGRVWIPVSSVAPMPLPNGPATI